MNLETWFSGGGLADIGFQQAGLKPTRAIEIDPAINDQCYSLGVRSVARFQSVPDWYNMPDSPLGFKVLGNGVPPLLIQRVVESQLQG